MIVGVALSIPVTKTFSYSVPEKWETFVKPFSRVRVPFHNRILTGFVVGAEEKHDTGLKSIHEIVDVFPLVDGALAGLCEWASSYYIMPMGMILKYVLPASLQLENHVLIKTLDEHISGLEGTSLKKAYKSPGKDTIFQYFYDGSIGLQDVFTNKPFMPLQDVGATSGTAEKTLYVGNIDSRLEYYMTHIAGQINEGKNVLMLLPDYYAVGRFYYKALVERFRGSVIWYGSPVKALTKMETYFRARTGGGFVILGNKSSAFLPIAHNSLIIVERHEEDEYRNEEGFKFNANTIALRRAEIENVPVIFGSASPSMEMYKYVEDERLTVVEGDWVKSRKYSVTRHDRGAYHKGNLPKGFMEIINEAAEKRQNIAIYTPRRDYGSSIRCLECKEPVLCPLCEGALSYRRRSNRLICSRCNSGFDYREECPNCGSNIIYAPHVGVEFIEEKLKALFKQSHIISVTGETFKEATKALQKIAAGDHLILVGTQVLSKLYAVRVDRLVLVGWEELFRIAGYRAEERMYQIFINLLDAVRPEETHFFMEKEMAVNPARYFDFKRFYADELKKRRIAEFPPYVRLFLIEVEKRGKEAGLKLVERIKIVLEHEGLTDRVTGPLEQKRKGGHRWRFILKGDERLFYRAILSIYDMPGVQIEADPLNI